MLWLCGGRLLDNLVERCAVAFYLRLRGIEFSRAVKRDFMKEGKEAARDAVLNDNGEHVRAGQSTVE